MTVGVYGFVSKVQGVVPVYPVVNGPPFMSESRRHLSQVSSPCGSVETLRWGLSDVRGLGQTLCSYGAHMGLCHTGLIRVSP